MYPSFGENALSHVILKDNEEAVFAFLFDYIFLPTLHIRIK